jgi:hypothetical protein
VLCRVSQAVDHEPMAELPRISRENRGRSGAVRTIAGDQEGIVARAQLERAGLNRWAIDRALRSGRLHLIHKGVYSTQAPELATEDALLIAALMAAGERAVLSHGTAAWRWQLIPAPPTRIELAVPRDRRAPPGLVLHEPLGPWTIDCLWPDHRVAVELDGRQHARPDDVIADLEDAFAQAGALGYAKPG